MPIPIRLDPLIRRMLLVDWFTRLSREAGVNFQQRSGDAQTFRVTDPTGFEVSATSTDTEPQLTFVSSDPARQAETNTIVAEAVRRIDDEGFGGVVWYSEEMSEADLPFFSPFSLMGPFFQRLGGQERILGWRRLGGNVLLEFTEDPGTEQGSPFAPRAKVRAHIAAPAPCEGFLSSYVANELIETVAAICTFALGRPVNFSHTIFPAKEEHLSDLNARRTDSAIYTLARKGVSLDIFSLLAAPGGFQVSRRARAALLTFDAATRQERDPVAAILYVAAAECLTVPNAEWRREKLTKRFIEFFDELMPGELDRIVSHGNFEEAFRLKLGSRTARALRRSTLDEIYSYRSGQVHEGVTPRSHLFGVQFDSSGFLRRGLLLDFAESAIVQYLRAPRSTLIGHPALSTDARSEGAAPAPPLAVQPSDSIKSSLQQLFLVLASRVRFWVRRTFRS